MFLMFSFAAQAWGNVDMASPCGGLILPINRQAWRVTQAWGNVDTASCAGGGMIQSDIWSSILFARHGS